MRQSDAARAINVQLGLARRAVRAAVMVVLASLACAMLAALVWTWQDNAGRWGKVADYMQAEVVLHTPHMFYKLVNTAQGKKKPEAVVADPAHEKAWKRFKASIESAFWWAFWAGLLAGVLIWILAGAAGRRMRKRKRLRGAALLPDAELARLLKRKRKASAFRLGRVPMVAGTESQHIVLVGAPGAGKSVLIHSLLDSIRNQGDRAIIYDSGGDYFARHSREGDTLLDPLDARSARWTPWAEMSADELSARADADRLAASFIPQEKGGNAIWPMAARTLYSALLFETRARRDLAELRNLLLVDDLETVASRIAGSEAAAVIGQGDADLKRTGMSVRFSLAPHMRGLRYLGIPNPALPAFSIKEWIGSGAGWLFLTSRPDQHDSLKPLIATWLDSAASAILSQKPDRDRRTWLIIDEAATLQKMPSLPRLMAQGRRYGACVLLAFQSRGQIRAAYGRDGADEIVDSARTRIIMAVQDPDTAEWASKLIGSAEVTQFQESYSVSTSNVHGMNISPKREQRRIVLADEITTLKPLHFYLRLPGEWPATQSKGEIRERPPVAEEFIPASAPPSPPKPGEGEEGEKPDKPARKPQRPPDRSQRARSVEEAGEAPCPENAREVGEAPEPDKPGNAGTDSPPAESDERPVLVPRGDGP